MQDINSKVKAKYKESEGLRSRDEQIMLANEQSLKDMRKASITFKSKDGDVVHKSITRLPWRPVTHIEATIISEEVESTWEVWKDLKERLPYSTKILEPSKMGKYFNKRAVSRSGTVGNVHKVSTFVEATYPLRAEHDLRTPHGDLVPEAIKWRMNSQLKDNKLLSLPDVSIMNFIYELRDIPDLVLSFISAYKKHIVNKSRKGGIDTIAEMHLGVSWGVLPFVEDLVAIVQILTRTRDRLASLPNEVQRVSVVENISHDIEESSVRRSKANTSCGAAVGKARGTMEFLISTENKVELLSLFNELLGVRNISECIWNAIPFSFVLDWFVDIGNTIKIVTSKPPIIKTEVLRAMYTYDVRLSYSVVDKYSYEEGYKDLRWMRCRQRPSYWRLLYHGTQWVSKPTAKMSVEASLYKRVIIPPNELTEWNVRRRANHAVNSFHVHWIPGCAQLSALSLTWLLSGNVRRKLGNKLRRSLKSRKARRK
jgi:hypothetical protein